MGKGEHNYRRLRLVLEVLGTDVLSTQSTRDPEVVKGISESIAEDKSCSTEKEYCSRYWQESCGLEE